jgi:hypothetical protein
MVRRAWELRMHFVDKKYRYTVATKGVLDAAGGEQMEIDNNDRTIAYEDELGTDEEGEPISYSYSTNETNGNITYQTAEEAEDWDETEAEYDTDKFGTFEDESLVVIQPTMPRVSEATLRAHHVRRGVIPVARKAEAIALASRALEILPDEWGRYPFMRVDVVCCLQGTDELFVIEVEPHPNWLMHHRADAEEVVHDIAVAYREFALGEKEEEQEEQEEQEEEQEEEERGEQTEAHNQRQAEHRDAHEKEFLYLMSKPLGELKSRMIGVGLDPDSHRWVGSRNPPTLLITRWMVEELLAEQRRRRRHEEEEQEEQQEDSKGNVRVELR